MDLNEARNLVLDLFNEHGLHGWTFRFDRAVSRFGYCKHSTKKISMSGPLVAMNDAEHVRATALHEIAHALAGRGHGHDAHWKRIAIRLGDDGERCYNARAVAAPAKRWRGSCHTCFHSYDGHKRRRVACKRCCNRLAGGKFDERFLITWEPLKTKEIKMKDTQKMSIREVVEPMLVAGTFTRKQVMDAILKARPDFKAPSAGFSGIFGKLQREGKNPAVVGGERKPRVAKHAKVKTKTDRTYRPPKDPEAEAAWERFMNKPFKELAVACEPLRIRKVWA